MSNVKYAQNTHYMHHGRVNSVVLLIFCSQNNIMNNIFARFNPKMFIFSRVLVIIFHQNEVETIVAHAEIVAQGLGGLK